MPSFYSSSRGQKWGGGDSKRESASVEKSLAPPFFLSSPLLSSLLVSSPLLPPPPFSSFLLSFRSSIFSWVKGCVEWTLNFCKNNSLGADTTGNPVVSEERIGATNTGCLWLSKPFCEGATVGADITPRNDENLRGLRGGWNLDALVVSGWMQGTANWMLTGYARRETRV